MADENFGIVVEINPRPALEGTAKVDQALERNERSAKEFATVADQSMRAVAAAAREAAREQEKAARAAAKVQADAAKQGAAVARQAAREVDESARAQIVAAERRAREREAQERRVAQAAKSAAASQKQAQAELSSAYKAIVGPVAEYNQKLAQAIQLERQGAISAQQRAQYVRGLQREVGQFNARQQGGFRGAVSEFAGSQLGAVAAPAALAATAVAAGREVISLSDAYKNLTNRIRTVTDTEAEALAVRAKLLEMSNRTRSDIGATTEGYVRLSAATKSLGLTQSQMLNFTESLNKTIKLSGATGAEAQAGLIQFAQGLGAGALRGDELRSVMEQLGPVADVIAKQLGTTRAGLKAFGEQGKITADVVVAAFAAQREEIDRKFGKSVATFSDLWTVLHNAIEAAVGQMVEAIGGMPELEKATKAAAAAVADMAHGFTVAIKDAKAFASVAGDLSGVLGQLTGSSDLASIATGNLFTNYGKVHDLIGGKSLGAAMSAEALKINEAIANWNKTVAAWQKITGGSGLVDRAMGGIGGGDVNAVIKAGFKDQQARKDAAREHAEAVREAAAAWKEWLAEVGDNGAGVLERTRDRITANTDAIRDAAKAAIETAEATRVANENMLAFAETIGGDLLDSLTAAGDMVTEFASAGAEGGIQQLSGLSLALTEQLGGALNQTIDALVEMNATGKATFADLTRSILADLERMLIKFLAFQAIKAAFGVSSGGFGAVLAGALGVNLGNNATGGSYVVPSTGGGVDSVPIYARATPGERVTFTPPGKAAPGEMASAGPVNVNAYIVHDAEAASIAALNTPAGTRAIITAIAANPGAIRAAVGR